MQRQTGQSRIPPRPSKGPRLLPGVTEKASAQGPPTILSGHQVELPSLACNTCPNHTTTCTSPKTTLPNHAEAARHLAAAKLRRATIHTRIPLIFSTPCHIQLAEFDAERAMYSRQRRGDEETLTRENTMHIQNPGADALAQAIPCAIGRTSRAQHTQYNVHRDRALQYALGKCISRQSRWPSRLALASQAGEQASMHYQHRPAPLAC
ncbi:hypothetical protein ERJ75_000571800 [Trypanosoma vivax]|nr:hypothetical protein ERJ75_000571800 [Trypanosoma vivax]